MTSKPKLHHFETRSGSWKENLLCLQPQSIRSFIGLRKTAPIRVKITAWRIVMMNSAPGLLGPGLTGLRPGLHGWGFTPTPPELIHRNMGAPYLRCNDPLTNFELYLALNRDISFVVFRNYKRRSRATVTEHKVWKARTIQRVHPPRSEDLKGVIADSSGAKSFDP
jgi:hypothetical protein